MKGIAMAQSGTVEYASVMVDATGSINNFIASVTVYVTYCKAMGTFAISSFPFRSRCVQPSFFQFFSVKVPSAQVSGCIIASAHHKARLFPIQIGNAGQIAYTAVAKAVSPCRI